MWVATQDLPRSAAHPFYRRFDRVLDNAHFDAFVEGACATFYAEVMGRPGFARGSYFACCCWGIFGPRLGAGDCLARGRFAERAEFPGAGAAGTDCKHHSTISRSRRLIDLETHRAVFTWVLQRLADAGLVKGTTIGIDATTLEANAALRSIVRRDTGETYQEFLTQLAQASGIETPTREDLARLDRKRKKKGSNQRLDASRQPGHENHEDEGSSHALGPEELEHAVDLETGAVVAVTVQDADAGDTSTSVETLIEAAEQVETVVSDGDGVQEVVGDKGYHSNQVMVDLEAIGIRRYISEPDRGRRSWEEQPEAQGPVYRNRRRIRGARGKRLLRLRGERLEHPAAHLYETGRMRRVHLRGHENILKRVLLQAGAFDLGLLMRQLIGIGTPRGLQGRGVALLRVRLGRFC